MNKHTNQWRTAEIVHKLKTWPEPFGAIVDGLKPFEIRIDDRDFKVGDHLLLFEYDPVRDTYPGGVIEARVTYILRGKPLPEGYCAMTIKVLYMSGCVAHKNELAGLTDNVERSEHEQF